MLNATASQRKRVNPSILYKGGAADGSQLGQSLIATFCGGNGAGQLSEGELSRFLRHAEHRNSPSTTQHFNQLCVLQAIVSALGVFWSIMKLQADASSADYRLIVASAGCGSNLLFAVCATLTLKVYKVDLDNHVTICILSGFFYALSGILASVASFALGARWVVRHKGSPCTQCAIRRFLSIHSAHDELTALICTHQSAYLHCSPSPTAFCNSTSHLR